MDASSTRTEGKYLHERGFFWGLCHFWVGPKSRKKRKGKAVWKVENEAIHDTFSPQIFCQNIPRCSEKNLFCSLDPLVPV